MFRPPDTGTLAWMYATMDRMGERIMPGGDTATFVLGDIVGSTRLWAEATDAMPNALGALDDVVNACVERHGGQRPAEQGEGDSFLIVFGVASAAAAFALDIQHELLGAAIAVRMGVHTGDALQREDGRWMGQTVNRAARLRDVAHGGQVLVSGVTSELVVESLPDGAWLKDLGVHRLKDLARSEHVRQLCHPDLDADFPSLRSLDKLPHNLPVELTSFVGRESELQALDEILEGARLVTLTGAGGCGKTRLAIRAAAQRVDALPGGVWLADLAPIVDPSLVPKVLATAMHLSERPMQSMTDTIVAHLEDERALVILDNCEHLLDATASFADRIVRGCTGVMLLATSREPLSVAGEVVYRVPSMLLPQNDEDAQCESVRLFEERARAVRPTFALGPSTLPAVIELCRRLDGLPLAIELAAARCRAMSPAEITSQLKRRLDVLSAGRRGALPRQRTLEASVEWSHDLLSSDEQALLRRLSVFAGGFTLEGAEHVGSSDGIDDWHVVDLLTSLVDKSLVQAEDSDDRTRYRLLETVRVFAARKLDDAGELASTRDRHLEHILALAEVFEAELYAGVIAAFDAVRREFENVRAALDWAAESGQGEAAWRLAAATDLFWLYENFTELLIRLDAMEALPGRPADRVRCLVHGSIAAWWVADVAKADALIARAEGLADDERLTALTVYARACFAMAQAAEDSVHAFDRAVAALEPFGVDYFLMDSICTRAIAYFIGGQLDNAWHDVERALGMARSTRSDFWVSTILLWVAIVAQFRGSFDTADAATAEIRTLGGMSVGVFAAFTTFAELFTLSARGRHEDATAAAEAALAEAQRYGQVQG
jgi:predicted ATPase/class 3 adenylate cyclase